MGARAPRASQPRSGMANACGESPSERMVVGVVACTHPYAHIHTHTRTHVARWSRPVGKGRLGRRAVGRGSGVTAIGAKGENGRWGLDGDAVDRVSSGSERQVDAVGARDARENGWAEARGSPLTCWEPEEAVGPGAGPGTAGMRQQAWRTRAGRRNQPSDARCPRNVVRTPSVGGPSIADGLGGRRRACGWCRRLRCGSVGKYCRARTRNGVPRVNGGREWMDVLACEDMSEGRVRIVRRVRASCWKI